MYHSPGGREGRRASPAGLTHGPEFNSDVTGCFRKYAKTAPIVRAINERKSLAAYRRSRAALRARPHGRGGNVVQRSARRRPRAGHIPQNQPSETLNVCESRAASRPWPYVMSIGVAAEFLSLGESTIRRELAAGRFPPAFRLVPGRLAWLRVDLERWAGIAAGHETETESTEDMLDGCFAAASRR